MVPDQMDQQGKHLRLERHGHAVTGELEAIRVEMKVSECPSHAKDYNKRRQFYTKSSGLHQARGSMPNIVHPCRRDRPAGHANGKSMIMSEHAIELRRFETPDQRLDMKEMGGISVLQMADGSTGMHAIFEKGWTWEKDEKPLLGSPDACPMRHTGYCISGTLVVRMADTGLQTRIRKGDFFEIPPGHDGFVDGSERVELILFAPPEHQH
jgi:hypothetical protein